MKFKVLSKDKEVGYVEAGSKYCIHSILIEEDKNFKLFFELGFDARCLGIGVVELNSIAKYCGFNIKIRRELKFLNKFVTEYVAREIVYSADCVTIFNDLKNESPALKRLRDSLEFRAEVISAHPTTRYASLDSNIYHCNTMVED